MKIHVLSDLHLELDRPATVPQVDADLVVLAGDIHNHTAGLQWGAAQFAGASSGAVPQVVYVAGNHEYYDGEMTEVETAMRETATRWPHLHFLNRSSLVDPGGRWRVLGTTLWTDFALFGDSSAAIALAQQAATRSIYDYQGVIQLADADLGTPRALTPNDTLALHREARAWLSTELARPFAGHTIVVTHHAPHRLSLAERFAQTPVSAGFISDLDALLGPPVSLWIHGHTHTSFDYTVRGTRVVCNPRGYLDRRTKKAENPAFAWDCVVELE